MAPHARFSTLISVESIGADSASIRVLVLAVGDGEGLTLLTVHVVLADTSPALPSVKFETFIGVGLTSSILDVYVVAVPAELTSCVGSECLHYSLILGNLVIGLGQSAEGAAWSDFITRRTYLVSGKEKSEKTSFADSLIIHRTVFD